MLFLSVFFVSLSTLAFEVLLTRVFSIGQWNHLSFMVISIALFGFGASGTFLSIVDSRKKQWLQSMVSSAWLSILLYIYTITAIFSFIGLNYLPLDYFRLPVEPIQTLYLLSAFVLLALPFFFSGMVISLAYISSPQRSGLVYFASMAGSAAGAVLPAPLLPLLGEGRLIMLAASIALLPLAYSCCFWGSKNNGKSSGRRQKRVLGTAGLLTLIIFVTFALGAKGGSLVEVRPSPYKALSQILQFPATRILERKTGLRGRIDRIETPYIRFAPGMSLKYTEALPGQNAVFRDGDNQLVLYGTRGETGKTAFAGFLLSYVGYYLRDNPAKVLLILSGGGSSIPCASASGARQISIVEQSDIIARLLDRHYRHRVIQGNPRTVLAQETADFDIIHIENWGTSVPGSAALNQEHFFTIEAFSEYFNHLSAGGIIIVSRKLLLPPSDSLRQWATAYEALIEAGIARPEKHMALLRNFDTFTMLVSKTTLAPYRVAEFARSKNFDMVFLPGLSRSLANRYHIFDSPYYYDEINRLAEMYRSGRQNEYFDRYLLDVRPQSDMRPFPGRFLKWSRIKELYQSTGSRLYALFMSGEIVVSVVFFEALLIALALLIIPLLVSTRGVGKPGLRQVIYFFAIGTGFMFVEIYFIKRFIILVGEPVISFTVVVAGILFFSCLGGIWAYKKKRCSIRLSLAILVIVLFLEAIGFELMRSGISKAPTPIQYGIIFLLLMPPGFLMGLPFPLGMRNILQTPVQRAYAWSVNGCASVLSSILAAQIAISWGILHVAAAGVVAYIVAILAVKNNIW
jgi:hypothetical protein